MGTLTLDTAFNLASMGKMFTGVAVAQLVEAGKSGSVTESGSTFPGCPRGCARSRSRSWHNGGAPGAAGELDIDPKLGIVAVTLGNVSPPHVFPVATATLSALGVP